MDRGPLKVEIGNSKSTKPPFYLPNRLGLIIVLTKPLTTKTKCNVMVVQPNIDPYNDKFFVDYQSQFFKALNLIKGYLVSLVNLLLRFSFSFLFV